MCRLYIPASTIARTGDLVCSPRSEAAACAKSSDSSSSSDSLPNKERKSPRSLVRFLLGATHSYSQIEKATRHEESLDMSEPEIMEAVDTRNELNAEKYAQMATDKEQQEIDISRAMAEMLAEVEEVVDELHAFRHAQSNAIWDLGTELPHSLRVRIWKLSEEGLEELPQEIRQEERLRIVEALGLCLELSNKVTVMDKELIGESELSPAEVEALYRRLESSTALTWVNIDISANASENWEPESWRLLADILLGAQSLAGVTLKDQPLSQLAKAVAASGRGPSPVEWVTVKHGLRERSGGTTGSVTAEWAETVANLTVAAPNLKTLYVDIGPFADEDVAELIGEAVVWLPSLETLHIIDVGGECDSAERESDGGETSVLSASIGDCDSAELESETSVLRASIEKKKMDFVDRLLSRAFLGNPCNTSINCLDVDFDEKGASSMPGRYLQVLCPVLQMNTHITRLQLSWRKNLLARDLRDFLKSLPVNGVSLQCLVLSQYRPRSGGLPEVGGPESLAMGFDPDSFSTLVEILKSNSVPGLKHLNLYIGSSNPDYKNKALDWPSLYSSLAQMESVSVQGSVGLCQAEREVMGWIQTSQALQKLALLPHVAGDEASKVNWRSIFHCLRENRIITHLEVPGAALEDDRAYRELMEVLQVNSTLQEVDFNGYDSSRVAAVREALKGTARQESYLAELQKGLGGGRGKWQSPKCGRVFLCGAPEAGKTRLTRSMLKVAQGKSFVKKVVNSLVKKLRRTEGVEIHTLRNDEIMQILVWDLAGQDIFRALQQFLFPRLSRALLFIFVFSPFLESPTREMTPKCDMEIAFRKELVEWLRFIASNSAVTGCSVPQVMVVISHKDIYQSNDVDVKWSEKILVELITVFQDVIHILPKPYFINGGDSQHVELILDEVYSIFDNLFEKKLFKVPIACSQLSQHIVQWASENSKKPVIEDQTFFSLCGSVSDFQAFSSKCHEEENRKLLKATASYLHDVGTIIDMTAKDTTKEKQGKPECNLIVVNPNWLTHVFLGRFICYAQEFQLSPGEEVHWVESTDGFLCEADFQHLLRGRFLKPMKNQFPNITLGILQDLMQNLDLLYITEAMNEHNVSRFFIPTLFKTRGDQTLCWHQNTFPESSGLGGDISFLGLRLCCKDSTRTYLSPAFFSRYQVMTWRKWKEELHLRTSLIECKFNLISILVDGFEILIENDTYGDFIDVLIRSNRSRKTVWEFAEKQIVEELRGFCASSKGCPGVELVMHIIRTECVKRPTLCKHRKSQSVSREDLKRTLMESLQKATRSSEERYLPSHTWKAVLEANLEAGFENVVELLSPKDVHEAYIWVEGQTQSLQQKVVRLEDVSNLVDIDRSSMGVQDQSFQINNLLEKKKFVRSRSDQWVSPIMQGIHDLRRGIQDIKGDVRRVGEDVKEVLAGVQDLKDQIREMNRLQQTEAKKVTQMYDKLDQLMGNSMSTTEWPKRPYFTNKDVSVSHRITAVVEIAKPLVLHFECEARDGHHFVWKQPGYPINVGRENYEALRQISKTSVRVIWYLLKAGLHISTGIGELLELQTSDGKITSLTSLSIACLLHKVQLQDGSTSNQTADVCSPEKAWRYLQDFLCSDLMNKITEHFLLHAVQYLDSKFMRAWLCQKCLEKGLKGNKLKKL